jgi:hypothetical protein
MLDIVKSSSNGNGLNSINGRGLARRHLTVNQRIDLAADLACGQQHLHPSIRHVAALLKVLPLQVSERLKARAQQEAEWRSQEEAEAVNAEAEILADTWRSISPESREVAIRLLGPGAVWDVIARVVA